MSGLPWFELEVDYAEHPKIIALAVEMKEPLAEAYVTRVWAYCYHHATDRFVGKAGPGIIETAARWRGEPGHLVAALLSVGLLDRDGDDLVAHGVAERIEPHIAYRKKDAERKRRRRAQVAKEMERDHHVARNVQEDVPRDVQEDVKW